MINLALQRVLQADQARQDLGPVLDSDGIPERIFENFNFNH